MIIANLAYDIRSLRTCTLTCYSWYIAAVPHLHYNLFIGKFWGKKSQWPNPLQRKHALGLLPFVKTFWVRVEAGNPAFSPKGFDSHILHQFSALNNVRRLVIGHLDIPSFMPRIQQYFGHFLPTVRELYLNDPKGSHRQIIYFIGLFENLEDLHLVYNAFSSGGEPADDLTLFPRFTPPLRGCLELTCIMRVDLLKDMIDLFGGFRFRRMGLWGVDGMPLLLDASAKTLEALRLYPTDPRCEWFL